MAGSLDRAKGALVGLALGDALGTTLEFASRDTRPPVTDLVGGGPFGLAAGEWTDDTSMALCLAESLHERGGLDVKDLMVRFIRWREEGHNSVTGVCFDIGNATDGALRSSKRTGEPLSGSTDPRCGACRAPPPGGSTDLPGAGARKRSPPACSWPPTASGPALFY